MKENEPVRSAAASGVKAAVLAAFIIGGYLHFNLLGIVAAVIVVAAIADAIIRKEP